MAAAVVPLFHRYETPPEPVSVALAPTQILPSFGAPEVSVTATEAVGNATTATADDVVVTQPKELVTVTV
jgi:hypothetical protein